MAESPHIPWTPAQRKKLCSLLREHGLWDDRHQVCGISSLSALTKDQASSCIDRLERRPRDPYAYNRRPKRHRGRRLDPGEVRLADDASNRQRRTVEHLFNLLNWPPATRHSWLRHRYGIAYSDLHTAKIDRVLLHDVITHLDQAAHKRPREELAHASTR